ncbi:MAG: phosphomethylpyrimidine synthase ThiC, partial [Pseudomonadota bacterium]
MSATADSIQNKSAQLSDELTQPFSGSQKIYVQGSRDDINVGMREVSCANTSASFGEEENPPITIYDTSGPYTHPSAQIDLLQGLAPVRSNWITEREDTEI